MATGKKKTTRKQKKALPAAWAWLQRTRLLAGGLFVLSFLLYANTFTHDFAQDDAIVITENMFTTEGLDGIPGLFKYDTFYGFFKVEGKAKLVAGGRYRPLTPAMFAVEYGSLGASPGAMHVFNAFWYGLTVMMLYLLLLALFRTRKNWDDKLKLTSTYWIPLLAALLFAVHPIHTEVVANIKGRDEIITLLGSIASLWLLLKGGSVRTILAGVCFLAALSAKENAITFLGVVPLAYYVFTRASVLDIIKKTSPLLVATVVFLLIRGSILGWDIGTDSKELMNNPFLKLEQGRWVDFNEGEKAATITYTLGKYAQLLVAPVALTHDYYPRHVAIMQWSDWRVLLSLLLYLGLLGYGLWGLTRKSIGSFAVLYYLGTLSLVSNIVFPVGTNMSERFLFMPSVGFALLVAWLLSTFVGNRRAATGVALGISVIFVVLTLLRNPAWKNNYTLFTTDIHTSPNSAKLRNATAGELSVQWAALPPAQQQTSRSMLNEALGHIEEAIRLHPTYKQAYFIKGNILNYLQQYDASIQAYLEARRIDPSYEQAFDNLMITYRDAGRYYGEQKGDIRTSLQYLEQAYQAMPNDYETIRLLGVAHGIAGNTPRAIELFRKNTELQPTNARTWYDLGTAFINNDQETAANEAFFQARQLDPEIDTKVRSGN